jgi:subtilisin family serine protease
MMRIASTCLLILFAGLAAAGEGSVRMLPSAGTIQLDSPDTANASKVYIVQLRTPSVAERHSATMKSASRDSAAIKDYASRLGAEQQRVLAKAGQDVQQIYSYRYGLNGFAARMRPSQADKLSNLPEVLQVWEDEIRPLATNYSAEFLGLFEPETGLRGAPGLDGEGVIIGIIDSGVAPEHPALRDTRPADRPRACESSWAENTLLGKWLCSYYDRLEDVVLFDEPEGWNGECQSGEEFATTNCNNKLIGARWFVDGARNTGPIDSGEIFSARDVDGHGTHTATTAAGNRVKAAIFGTSVGRVEGIAPQARVAVYKACWLRPGDLRASCNTSDLANAIDAAVADGVDIINYSVGSSLDRITAPDDVALMGATKAGVLAVVAAGNEGPNLSTVGSPAGGPWVIAAAASTRDGSHSVEAMQVNTPPSIAGKYAVREANFTPPLQDNDPIEASLILVDDDDATGSIDGPGTESDACQAIVNDDEVSGNIAFVQRGGCSFDVKVRNAANAGAVAVLVYNIAGDPILMTGISDPDDVPALMIGQADANLILAEFDAGNDVTVVLDKGLLLTKSDAGNEMASFSARGPGPVPDILKPDVTAPGVNILAGFTPDAANAMPGENFAYISGTSMSTPHVAGVAALIKQAHPEWSPAVIKSALMTTARRDLVREDGETQAIPFDFGAGHIVPNDALDPGLVFEVSVDEYDAFACGTESPAVAQDRCDALVTAGFDFEPSSLNQPSIALSQLVNQQTITRRVHNPGTESRSFVTSVNPPPGITVAVDPPSINVPAGSSASYDVTMTYESGPLDLWRFGSLSWINDEFEVFSTLALRPASIKAPVEITTFGGTGSVDIPVEFGYSGSYNPRVHGLALPTIVDGFVDNDPNKTFTVRSGGGVTQHKFLIPADQLYLRFSLFDALTDGDDDLDMYIYYSPDDVTYTKVGQSGEPTSQERFDYFRPPAGYYAVLIHGFETDQVSGGVGANYQLLAWRLGIDNDLGNMTANGPSVVNAGTTDNVVVNWSNLQSDAIYLGAISHNTPQGISGLTLITIGN